MSSDAGWPWCGEYEKTFLSPQVLESVIRSLDIREQSKVADLGCGNAKLAAEIARRFSTSTVIACDVDDGAVRLALERASRLPNLAVLKGDLTDIFVAFGSSDRIICRNVIHFLSRLDSLLSSVAGNLNKGGRFLLEWPSARNLEERDYLEEISLAWDSARPRFYYTIEQVAEALTAHGLTSMESERWLVARRFDLRKSKSHDRVIHFDMEYVRIVTCKKS